ncbi:MAG TPA: DUF5330 domain-containing protein [Xanthobacteraceae bacterium]|jgi:hypothetical protein|nr:DUF5330 domain-containing protein [Xanthobacteraceae bacterium]
MRFLLKIALVLGVIFLMLPSLQKQAPASTPQVGTWDAVSAANAAVSDMRQFCSRQPDACAIGMQALTQFAAQAQVAAKMFTEFVNEQLGIERSGVTGTIGAEKLQPSGKPSQQTLTPADKGPVWRSPTRKEAPPRQPA